MSAGLLQRLLVAMSMVRSMRSTTPMKSDDLVQHLELRQAVIAAVDDAPVAEWLCTEMNRRLSPAAAGWHWSSASAEALSGSDEVRPTAAASVTLATSGDDEGVPTSCGGLPDAPGSFLLHIDGDSRSAVRVLAADSAGLRAGAARLLREAHMPAPIGAPADDGELQAATSVAITVPASLCVRYDASMALWHTRGTMVHPFRTQPELARYAQDLATFGTNQLEMVCGETELSAPSPSQLASMVAFSDVCQKHGMNMSLFAASESSTGNYTAMVDTFRRIPTLASVFMPGGDGGQLVWTAVENVTAALRQAHPRAGTWVSAQMLDGAALQEFWLNVSHAIAAGHLSGGVVYGPHVRLPLTAFVEKAQGIGARVRQYPDITHLFGDSFPVPNLHAAWSLTHERQACCPMPQWAARIVKLRGNGSTPSVGAGAYSEGLGDDLNKVIWSAIAQDPRLTAVDVTKQYARYHFGAATADVWTEALLSLEQNWLGMPGSTNTAIPHSLALLRNLTAASPNTDWRAQMYLKRAYFDAYKLQPKPLVFNDDSLPTLVDGIGNRHWTLCIDSDSDRLLTLSGSLT